MHLLAARGDLLPLVLTVDHGLRKGSGADARQVVAWAKALGLPAKLLAWRGKKPGRGLEAAARIARYRLMGRAMKAQGIGTLYVGHTQDDQAETFLLRLARGSGLDGLAAMQAQSPWPVPGFDGLAVHRPLLGITRSELRAYLTARGQAWIDDPMNDDPAFDRVKLRQARAALDDLGLTPARLAGAAAHLARARAALEVMTDAVLDRAARPLAQGYLVDAGALVAAPREVALRALAALLGRAGGQAYRPRFDSLERLFAAIVGGTLGGGMTLHGCHIRALAPGKAGKIAQALVIAPEKPRKSNTSVKSRRPGS